MNKKKKKRIERYKSYRDRIPLLSAAISTIMATECLIGSDIFKLASLILFEFCLFLVSWSLVISCWELFVSAARRWSAFSPSLVFFFFFFFFFVPRLLQVCLTCEEWCPFPRWPYEVESSEFVFSFNLFHSKKTESNSSLSPFFPFLSFLFP